QYFGRTRLKTMANWVKLRRNEAAKDKKKAEQLTADFEAISQWLAGHPGRDKARDKEQPNFAEGLKAFSKRCSSCHTFEGEGEAKGPDFTGYGDADWLRVMVTSPDHPSRYGIKNRMPIFRDFEGPSGEVVRQDVNRSRELLLKMAAEDSSADD